MTDLDSLERRSSQIILNKEDLRSLAKSLVLEIQKEIRDTHTSFEIDREDHYNQHQELRAFLNIYNDTRNKVLKFFLGMFFLGVTILAGLGFHSKFSN